MNHEQMTNINRTAWESQSYEAWVSGYGLPASAANELVRDPNQKLRRLLPYLNNLPGKNIVNPLGSHGRIAVSLALLGAKVTVLDISEPNRRYAMELAECAGVDIEYKVGDFLKLAQNQDVRFDYAVMELGILHYFNDLSHFTRALANLLKPTGIIVLNEFHPLIKKAIDINETNITLSGDYFFAGLESAATPYKEFLSGCDIPASLLRRWNLGEIVTSFAECGFRINKLVEEPSPENNQLPGTFTLVATID